MKTFLVVYVANVVVTYFMKHLEQKTVVVKWKRGEF